MRAEDVALYGGIFLTLLTMAGGAGAWLLNRETESSKALSLASKEAQEKEITELEREVHNGVTSMRERMGILFDKLDAQSKELHEYKLHVAETYVNQAALEKIFEPISRRLENIENDLRQGDRARG